MKNLIISAVVILAVLIFSFPAFAERDGHCRGSRIVSLGDRYDDVLAKCGDPDDYSYFVNRFGVRMAVELRYDRDKGQFPMYLFFDRSGICIRIRMGAERN